MIDIARRLLTNEINDKKSLRKRRRLPGKNSPFAEAKNISRASSQICRGRCHQRQDGSLPPRPWRPTDRRNLTQINFLQPTGLFGLTEIFRNAFRCSATHRGEASRILGAIEQRISQRFVVTFFDENTA